MKDPYGVVIGKKYCVFHVSKSMQITTILSEFKVVHAKKERNTVLMECEYVRKSKYKPERFAITLDSYNDGHVLHPKLGNIGEEDGDEQNVRWIIE